MADPKKNQVPCFDSVEEFKHGLAIKKRFGPIDLYPRDGCVLLTEIEARIAGLMGVGGGTTVAHSSGMTAACSAIDVALDHAASDRPKLAFSYGLYKQTRKYIERHLGKRVAVRVFDSGSTDDVRRLLDKFQPDVIVAESISNHIDAPVLDTGHLLELARSSRHAPTLVIDNTLPLSTGLPLAAKLRENDRIIVVESGTKSYTFNQELLGIAYTRHSRLGKSLQDYRRTAGTIPGGAGLRHIAELLPKTKAEFDGRNRRLFENTETLACALAGAGFAVSHPAVATHPNHGLYQRDFPAGGTPVFYIRSAADYYELAARLWLHPKVRRHARLGQSFGFDETRILIDENAGAVRLAGGAETDAPALASALIEALNFSESKGGYHVKTSYQVR